MVRVKDRVRVRVRVSARCGYLTVSPLTPIIEDCKC